MGAKKEKPTLLLTIGDLSRLSGVSQRVIHLHEQRGLISSERKTKLANRYFKEESIVALHKIKQLQAIGLSLQEIAQVLPLYVKSSDGGVKGKQAVLKILREHLKESDQKIKELHKFRTEILRSLRQMEKLLEQAKKKDAVK